MANPFNVGDVLVYVFHYNARYPQFVRVTRTTEKSVWLEHLEKKWESHDGYGQNGVRVPDFDAPARPMRGSFRVHTGSSYGPYLKVEDCYCFPWDGKGEDEYTD